MTIWRLTLAIWQMPWQVWGLPATMQLQRWWLHSNGTFIQARFFLVWYLHNEYFYANICCWGFTNSKPPYSRNSLFPWQIWCQQWIPWRPLGSCDTCLLIALKPKPASNLDPCQCKWSSKFRCGAGLFRDTAVSQNLSMICGLLHLANGWGVCPSGFTVLLVFG